MSRRQIVLLDCDGPLASFTAGFLAEINTALKTKFKPEQVTDWDILKCLKLDKQRERIYDLLKRPNFCYELPIVAGAQEAVAKLREVADVYVVTAPMQSVSDWTRQRERWLKKHFDIEPDHVIHTVAKHLVRGDVFVDDKFENCEIWQTRNRTAFSLLWDLPHNQEKDASLGLENEGVIRVKDWKTVEEAVKFYD